MLRWPITEQFRICSFSSYSSIAVSSATSKHGTVAERIGQNHKWTKNFASSRKVISQHMLSFLLKTWKTQNNPLVISSLLELIRTLILSFYKYGNPLMYCFYWHILCSCGIKHFDVHFRWIRPAHFCCKMKRTRPMRKEMDGMMFFLRQSLHFCFVNH